MKRSLSSSFLPFAKMQRHDPVFPLDVFNIVAKYLPSKDIGSLRAVSKRLNTIASRYVQNLWFIGTEFLGVRTMFDATLFRHVKHIAFASNMEDYLVREIQKLVGNRPVIWEFACLTITDDLNFQNGVVLLHSSPVVHRFAILRNIHTLVLRNPMSTSCLAYSNVKRAVIHYKSALLMPEETQIAERTFLSTKNELYDMYRESDFSQPGRICCPKRLPLLLSGFQRVIYNDLIKDNVL